eukprot:TRINITY_DN4161_c0_g1_i1.p1 TRINITY_DN4161_c0_g1~~TRINITY_DN4161_c0_g1_i1.p1  ORF type:complete len:141 (+),score=33.80 TRINITY_DN4161_c0_g1_i1:68-490(+)
MKAFVVAVAAFAAVVMNLSWASGQACTTCNDVPVGNVTFCTPVLKYSFCTPPNATNAAMDKEAHRMYNAFLKTYKITSPTKDCIGALTNYTCYSVFSQCTGVNTDYPAICQDVCFALETACMQTLPCWIYKNVGCTPTWD